MNRRDMTRPTSRRGLAVITMVGVTVAAVLAFVIAALATASPLIVTWGLSHAGTACKIHPRYDEVMHSRVATELPPTTIVLSSAETKCQSVGPGVVGDAEGFSRLLGSNLSLAELRHYYTSLDRDSTRSLPQATDPAFTTSFALSHCVVVTVTYYAADLPVTDYAGHDGYAEYHARSPQFKSFANVEARSSRSLPSC